MPYGYEGRYAKAVQFLCTADVVDRRLNRIEADKVPIHEALYVFDYVFLDDCADCAATQTVIYLCSIHFYYANTQVIQVRSISIQLKRKKEKALKTTEWHVYRLRRIYAARCTYAYSNNHFINSNLRFSVASVSCMR